MSKEQTDWPGDDLQQLVSVLETIEYVAHNDIKADGMKAIWDFARYAQGIAPRIREALSGASPSPAGGVQGVTEEMVERAARSMAEGFDGPYPSPEAWIEYQGFARAALTAALSSQAQTTGGVE